MRVALRPDLTSTTSDPAAVGVERHRRWIMPIETAATLALAFVTTHWNVLAMLPVPVLRRVPPFQVVGKTMEVEGRPSRARHRLGIANPRTSARHPTLRITSSSRATVALILRATSVFFTVRPSGSR